MVAQSQSLVLWDCPASSHEAPSREHSIFLLSGFSSLGSQQGPFARGVFSCVGRVPGIVHSEKHPQTIIDISVKPAINLFYWLWSLCGCQSRIDIPQVSESGRLRAGKEEPDRQMPGEDHDQGKQGGGSWPELLRQSLRWKNCSGGVQKESCFSQKLLQRR